jgi:hypothetical protein
MKRELKVPRISDVIKEDKTMRTGDRFCCFAPTERGERWGDEKTGGTEGSAYMDPPCFCYRNHEPIPNSDIDDTRGRASPRRTLEREPPRRPASRAAPHEYITRTEQSCDEQGWSSPATTNWCTATYDDTVHTAATWVNCRNAARDLDLLHGFVEREGAHRVVTAAPHIPGRVDCEPKVVGQGNADYAGLANTAANDALRIRGRLSCILAKRRTEVAPVAATSPYK